MRFAKPTIGFDTSGPIAKSGPAVRDKIPPVGPSVAEGLLSTASEIQKYAFKFLFL